MSTTRQSQDQTLVSVVAIVNSMPKGKRVFTAKQVNTTALTLRGLAAEGYVEDSGDRFPNIDPDTGNTLRGRPSHGWKITRQGRTQAARVAKQAVAA